MKPFKHTKAHDDVLAVDKMLQMPDDLKESLSDVVSFIQKAFPLEVSWVGLYGSWQRGDANQESDVDIAVFLNHGVDWFDSQNGIVDRAKAMKDKRYWHAINKKVNERRFDSRILSISVVTPGMLAYYSTQGLIHLQNWAHAIRNCFPIWVAKNLR